MSTLLSRIFGRRKAETPPPASDTLDISALQPLMSPSEFAETQAKRQPVALPNDPEALAASWPMGHVLKVFPSAQRALFQKFHIGGCSSCGYTPHDTLEKVALDHGLEPETVVRFIKESADLERNLEVTPQETAELLRQGAIKLLDVRSPQEYEIARIEGSVLVDQALAQEIVNTWPQDTPIVTLCHHGMRSLDAAAYLRGHGFRNARSMRGGIDAWSMTVDSNVPRY